LKIVGFIFFRKSEEKSKDRQKDKKPFRIRGFGNFLYKLETFEPDQEYIPEDDNKRRRRDAFRSDDDTKEKPATEKTHPVQFDDSIRKIYPD